MSILFYIVVFFVVIVEIAYVYLIYKDKLLFSYDRPTYTCFIFVFLLFDFIIYKYDYNITEIVILLLMNIPLYEKYMFFRKRKKLHKQWKAVRVAYEKDDFGSINKAVKKIEKIEKDPLLMLLDVEKVLYGKTVLQDKKKAMEILLEVDKIKIPPKTRWEKNKHTKKYAAKTRKNKKKAKREKYLKKIKGKGRETWNNNSFWALKHDYYSEIHTHKDEPIETVVK